MADGTGMLNVREAATWLRVSRSTLFTLPIRYVKIGRRRVYDPRDLQEYADLHGNRKPMLRLRRGAA